MIELSRVHAGYGDTGDVLHGISLSVHPGELVGLLGPNGSGKTTLLLVLSGVLAPRCGTVTLDGAPLHRLRPRERARRIAAVPQRPEHIPDLDALSLVLMGRYPHTTLLRGYGPDDHAAALAALNDTGCAHLAARGARTLSGGELQRVLLARALAQGADTLLLDEATAGLDVARALDILDLLHARHRAGARIVAAVHDLNLAALYCTRLIFLKHGRVVEDGPVERTFTATVLSEVYETPVTVQTHPVTGAPQACYMPGAFRADMHTGLPAPPVEGTVADATGREHLHHHQKAPLPESALPLSGFSGHVQPRPATSPARSSEPGISAQTAPLLTGTQDD
ncbi:MAG: ABC transporter ATP-binding protein [Desulfovibrio sp.]|jgi:iron complex transport system ATP-binding protein|nr:ABC transporter ATP-binding protein [Desulfovibrio sp.]